MIANEGFFPEFNQRGSAPAPTGQARPFSPPENKPCATAPAVRARNQSSCPCDILSVPFNTLQSP